MFHLGVINAFNYIMHVVSQVNIIKKMHNFFRDLYIDGLVQDCSNSIANALELL